ncbi:DsbA family protein [Sphingomonas jatrophae]|uniref:Protein-disulfide isomerase n=1 Tax=Sphingomonas jatrophae TaxID=1166337 RepID=A0A1I6KY29_9SPHN|nr:thioredoxin domain-containing protein [Sphingomonas jatrophae]SFR96115.1 Protein-disulfide isomerase [Sphingomonas jatrophae]
MRAVLLSLALLGLAAPAVAAPRKPAAPAARDWTRMLVQLPDGAYRLGNPAAKVKLTEYLSLSCSHCAHFSQTGLPVLMRDYVRPGRVSIEFRHAVRDGFDLAASLLARCGGPARYIGDMDALFRAQPQWIAKAEGFTPPSLPQAELLAAFADATGMTALMAQRGLPPAKARACLRDPAGQKPLLAMAEDAFGARQLKGTPGFAINGQMTPVFAWEPLKPLIDAALR